MEKPARIAIFPGSFNPFTTGHRSIVDRARPLFDRIVIGIGINAEKAERGDVTARVEAIKVLYADCPDVEVQAFSTLAADFASQVGARWILRGVRSVKDYEYELAMADVNRRLAGLETVILPALPELGCVSSSLVRELASYGADVSEFIPQRKDSK